MNDRTLWQENQSLTKKVSWYLLAASLFCFFMAGVINAEINKKELFILILEQFDTIGALLFAALTLGCWIGIRSIQAINISSMSTEAVRLQKKSLRTLRGVTILFFILFGGFFVSLSFRAHDGIATNIVAITFSMGGFAMILFFALSRIMARTIKLKYLTTIS